MAVGMILQWVVLPQCVLHISRAPQGWKQPVAGQLIVGERERKATAVGQGADATVHVNQIAALESKFVGISWRHRMLLRIAKDAQEVSVSNASASTKEVVKVDEVVEHEFLCDDVLPVLVSNLADHGRA